jgi:serine/threonine-protein kinase RsbW
LQRRAVSSWREGGLEKAERREGSWETAALNKQYRAAFTSDIRNVAAARQGVAGFAAGCGFREQDVSDIRLAAGEALSNAVEHGSESAARRIIVDCTFDGSVLAIEIRDSGRGFTEPSDCPIVTPDDRGRGFGIFLMRRLMDEVMFSRNGTVVRLIRRRT